MIPSRRHLASLAALLMIAGSGSALADSPQPLGIEIPSTEGLCGGAPLPPAASPSPPLLLLHVRWDGERETPGTDALIECAQRDEHGVVIQLDPPARWQQADDPYAALEEWLGELEDFYVAHRREIGAVEIGARPESRFEPSSYAFLVEKIATLIRSIDPGSTIFIGPVGGEALEWLGRARPDRLAPYAAGIALEDPLDLPAWLSWLRQEAPGWRVWLHTGSSAENEGSLLLRYHEARRAGIETVFTPSSPVIRNLRRLLPDRFEPATDPGGGETPVALAYFADALGPEKAVVALGTRPAVLSPTGARVTGIRAFDLATGSPVAPERIEPAEGGRAIIVRGASAEGPVVVRYVPEEGLHAPAEAVSVSSDRDLTAAEIVAGERAFQAEQDRRLDHYRAVATLSYDYTAEALGESINVTTKNSFYWKDGTGQYDQTDLYVNGARWRGKPPDLPFIQPEKVQEAPLEIRLDESYRYRLAGKETIDGEPAYHLEFEPAEPDSAAYSGDVWIQRNTFARLRIRLIQHGLKDPITSNVDTIEYGQVGVDGGDEPAEGYWLPLTAYRQMVFTVLGRSILVQRRILYEEFRVNTSDYQTQLQASYDSGRPILRDDDSGTAYLIKHGDARVARDLSSRTNVAFFTGLGVNTEGSLGTPFAGFNYFDFDWRGTGTQVDMAFAGPLVRLAWTDPALGSSRWEMTLEGQAVGVKSRLRRTTESDHLRQEDLETLDEQAALVIGHPLGSFQKVTGRVQFDYTGYAKTSDTDSSFVPPTSGLTASGTLSWEYHRRGYFVEAWYTNGHRLGWEDWGWTDPNLATGQGLPGVGSAGDTGFDRWGMTVARSFLVGKLQTVGLKLSHFGGTGLDRFSRFRIGDFSGVRVHGYSSKDYTFDQGETAQINYRFTLPRGGVSVDMSLDGAWIQNEEDFSGRQYLLGGGLAVTTSGPWGTLLSFRSHFGLGSSFDTGSRSAPSIRIVMIKTMDHWPRWTPRMSDRTPEDVRTGP